MPDPLQASDVRTGPAYEEVRAGERQQVAESQRQRRIALDERLELVFESRQTVRHSLEEMLRAERIADSDAVEREVEAFNEFVPRDGRLGATLYVIADDTAELPTTLAELEGVRDTVYVEVDGVRVRGESVTDTAAEELDAASFVTFALDESQRGAWLQGAPVVVGVDHPKRSVSVQLSDSQREAIASDL